MAGRGGLLWGDALGAWLLWARGVAGLFLAEPGVGELFGVGYGGSGAGAKGGCVC